MSQSTNAAGQPSFQSSTPPNTVDFRAALDRLVAGIESARAGKLEPLLACVSPTVRFEDPFSRVNGHKGFTQVMEDTWRFFPGSRFIVRQATLDGNSAFIRWSLVVERHGKERSIVEAIGQLTFNEQGLVRRHVDYWDPVQSFWRRIPVLGWVLERLRVKASAGWEPEVA